MTRVYYVVGKQTTRSYQTAKSLEQATGAKMQVRYEEIRERAKSSPEELAKIYKYFEERRNNAKKAILQA